jgi:PIN domain nuclease of toxin-antitoxin system
MRLLLDTQVWWWMHLEPRRLRLELRERLTDGETTLPHHHGDPFDRLLVAQGQLERIPIVTADPAFERYDVPIVAAV